MKTQLSLILVILLISLANASSVGAELTVPPQNASSLNVSFNPASITQGGTVKIIADYEDNTSSDILSANVSLKINGNTYEMIYSAADSAYVYNYTFSSPGTYFFYVVAWKTGYDAKHQNVSYTVYPASSGGGGGGGFAPSPANETINITVNGLTEQHYPVNPDENITIIIDIYESEFQKLVITAAERISSGSIEISTDDCFHSLPEGRKFYKCISIDIGINESKYSHAFLYFRVSKEWITANNINHSLIGIMKFDEGIAQDLNIVRIVEEEDFIYYFTDFKSFSDFVIFGVTEDIYCGDGLCNSNENCSTCPEDCGECVIIPPVVEKKECELFGLSYGRYFVCWYWWTAVLTLIILYELVRILLKKPPFFRPRAVSAVRASRKKKRNRWSASYELEKKKWMENYEREREISLRKERRIRKILKFFRII